MDAASFSSRFCRAVFTLLNKRQVSSGPESAGTIRWFVRLCILYCLIGDLVVRLPVRVVRGASGSSFSAPPIMVLVVFYRTGNPMEALRRLDEKRAAYVLLPFSVLSVSLMHIREIRRQDGAVGHCVDQCRYRWETVQECSRARLFLVLGVFSSSGISFAGL